MQSILDIHDSAGRKILDTKSIALFEDNEIIFRGYIKKENYDKTIFFDNFDPYTVPVGYNRRKGNDYFYYNNGNTLKSFLNHKKENPAFGLTASFCVWMHNKMNELKEYSDSYYLVKDLLMNDTAKIESLPTLGPKKVSDLMHQKICAQWAYHMPNCGILLEMGLGKTKVAIDCFMAKRQAGKVDKMLVIAPKSVLGPKNWLKQIEEYGVGLSAANMMGNREEKLATMNGEYGAFDVYLMNYEAIANINIELSQWINGRFLIVLDEASKIKNVHAKRSQFCHMLGKLTRHKLILTGTPITQGAQDIFSQFLFLDGGDTFGNSYEKFCDNYFRKQGWKLYPTKQGLQVIKDKIKQKSIRFTKDECLDLPEKTFLIREVEMTDKQADIYKQVLTAEMARLSELEKIDAQNILVTIMRLQQVSDGMLVVKDLNGIPLEVRAIENNPKIAALDEILEEMGDTQIIIASRFKFMHKQIANLLKAKKITHTIYNGDMNDAQKNQAEDDFASGRVQAFITNSQSAGMGKNLQFCSHMVMFDNSYSLEQRQQLEDRIHRVGMGDKAIYTDIIAHHPVLADIDELVMGVLKNKKDVADFVTGDIDRIKKMFLGGK